MKYAIAGKCKEIIKKVIELHLEGMPNMAIGRELGLYKCIENSMLNWRRQYGLLGLAEGKIK